MMLHKKPIDSGVTDVAVVDAPENLSAFLNPGCAAAVWRRRMPVGVQSWLNSLDPEALPRARVIVPPNAITDAIQQAFDSAGLPAGPERDWLHSDVVALADLFADMMAAKFLRLRFDVIANNACRKFHIDAVTARLVCTYRGTGTQYGIPINSDTPDCVFTVQTGAPILLRGTQWPAEPPSGLVHRSPPIEGTGETRLLLVLDPIADPENEV